jgi:hypothetical protein
LNTGGIWHPSIATASAHAAARTTAAAIASARATAARATDWYIRLSNVCALGCRPIRQGCAVRANVFAGVQVVAAGNKSPRENHGQNAKLNSHCDHLRISH